MWLDAIWRLKNYKLKEMIELSKELAYVYNCANEYLINEEFARNKLKDIVWNKWEFPSRSICEKLFKELFTGTWILLRRLHWICRDIFNQDLKADAYIERFSYFFWENSYELNVITQNNGFLRVIYDIRWAIEHPKNEYEYNWFELDSLWEIHELPFISYKKEYYSAESLCKDLINFLVFHTPFMISSAINYRFSKEQNWFLRYIQRLDKNELWWSWHLVIIEK